ncbi:MAG: ABC transporter ATP-binding protein [Candidatus Paceibacterota bacterium]|jgi:ATP-binding cassette subfamily B protein
MKPYWLPFSLLFVLVSLRILFTLALAPFVYKNIIDVLSLTGLSVTERSEVAFLFLIPFAAGLVSSGAVNRYREFISFKILSNVTKDIYDFSFSKLANHSYTFYSNRFSGGLVAKVKRFARSFEVINKIIVGSFWFVMVLIIAATIILYSQSKIIALYLSVWSLGFALITLFFVKQKIKLDVVEAEADSRITAVLADSITNILNVKVFSAFQKELDYFKKFSEFLRERIYASAKFSMLRSIIQTVLMVAFQVYILHTMLSLWRAGEISLGVFTLTYVYVFLIFERIWDLSEDTATFMKAVADMKEMVDIFEVPSDIVDPVDPELVKIKEGHIVFKDVSFKYELGENVLANFNLDIQPGERVGLVGHSGTGKSTLTKLLLRFNEVTSGTIVIDGQNIRNITQDDLRRSISYVSQEPILFHRPIAENINYGKPSATLEETMEVAKKAHAHEFISKLSRGYATLVGERGVKLSGGERQRIAIARAMLKDAPIIVLDEATSSLDSVSEFYIQDAFGELMKGKTAIVIAHRLSTIQKMDRIVVLDQGQIVEEGTHKQLLAKGGIYADLWEHQTGGFLE